MCNGEGGNLLLLLFLNLLFLGFIVHGTHFFMIYEILILQQSEKAMAPHSSTLAWRIPGMGEPGGLPSMGSHRVGHD